MLSRYVERLRALGRERLRKTHPFCRLHSYLRRRHRKVILRKAQAAFSPSPPSKALAGVTARLVVVDHKVTDDDPVPDLRVCHHRVPMVRLRGGMQAAAPDADAAAAAMSTAMFELDVAAATPVRLASSSELIDRIRLRFHLRTPSSQPPAPPPPPTPA